MRRPSRWLPIPSSTATMFCGAGAWALACTWLLLDVAATQRTVRELSSPGPADWLPFAAAAASGLLLAVRSADGPCGRWRIGAWAAAVLGLGAATALVWPGASPGGASLRLVVQALGLGLVLGGWSAVVREAGREHAAPGRRATLAVAAIAASVAVAGAFAWAELEARLGRTVAGIGSLLAAVMAAFTLLGGQWRPRPRGEAGGGLAVLACVLAATCSWLAAPRALWHGPSSEGTAYCALLAVVGCALAMQARGLAVGAAITGVLLGSWPPGPGAAAGGGTTLVASSAGAAVVYERATQELQLFDGGQLVAAAGPDRTEPELAATLLQALLATGDRVLVLGCGERLAALSLRSGHDVELVHARTEAGALSRLLLADGPVAAPHPPRADAVRVRELGLRRALRRLPGACRQAVVLAEPLSAAAWPQVTLQAQRELARVAGKGFVVQVFSFDRAPAGVLRALFAAAAVAHRWNAVFAVGESALLVSAAAAPDWPPPESFAAWPDDARWSAHAAHLGGLADLQRACLGTLRALPAAVCFDDEPWPDPGDTGRRAVLAVLHEHLQPGPEVLVPRGGSVLLHWTAMQARMRSAAATLRTLGDDSRSHAEAAAVAAGFLPCGAPSAWLQAALGLPDGEGVSLRDPAAASSCAHALDPTFLAHAPAVFARLPRPGQGRGDLEDLAVLPAPARLREWCSGNSPRAVALRARFGSRCARALVEALAQQPLPAAMQEALRELADPFVLAAAGHVLAQRGALRELLGYWRGDLPMPAALDVLLRGDIADRRTLLEALPGRRGRDVVELLAHFLVSPEAELRHVACNVLRRLAGDAVPYDPDWPSSALNEAADRLRAMHNRNP